MNTTQIRNEVKNYIDKLSPEKLELVREFLKDLQEEEIDATEELLNIPGFESAFEKANQQIKEGKVRDWREIRNDV
jgi:hypothetical protein